MQSAVWNNLGSSMVLIASVATYGAHLVASLLYMDPLHVLTSAWAYFAGTTCSSNILMVYAFCNWHDVSIGTKVADKSESLPEVQTKKDEKSKFIEELDRPQIDIDTLFQATVKRALASFEPPDDSNGKDVDDLYKAFRTYLVLLWVFSNLAMVLCIMSTGISSFCLSVSPIKVRHFCQANNFLDTTQYPYLELSFGCGLGNSRDFTVPFRWIALVFGKDVYFMLCLTKIRLSRLLCLIYMFYALNVPETIQNIKYILRTLARTGNSPVDSKSLS